MNTPTNLLNQIQFSLLRFLDKTRIIKTLDLISTKVILVIQNQSHYFQLIIASLKVSPKTDFHLRGLLIIQTVISFQEKNNTSRNQRLIKLETTLSKISKVVLEAIIVALIKEALSILFTKVRLFKRWSQKMVPKNIKSL